METVNDCVLCGCSRIKIIDRKVNISKCRNCGHIFNSPRPTQEEVESYYSRTHHYDPWLLEEKQRERMWSRRLRIIEKERRSGRLLDVGAGTGHFLRMAKGPYEVTGTEISREAVRLAGEKNDVELIHGDLMDLELDTEFDIITIFHVLEHVHHPPALINRCRELLAPDGILIVAVPNDRHSLKSYVARLLALLGISKWKDYGLSGLPDIMDDDTVNEIHLSHFTTSCLKKFLSGSGFQVKDITLDPSNASPGFKGTVNEALYYCCLCLYKISRINLYDTTWITCAKLNRS